MFVVQICCHNSNITVATFRHKKKNWYFPYIFMLMFTLPRHKWLCHHVITQTCMLSCRLCGLGIVFMNLIKLLRRLRALDDLTFFRRWRLRLSHQLLLSSCGITFDLIVFSLSRKSLQPRKPAAKRQPVVTKSFTVPSSAGRRKKMEETKKRKGPAKSLRVKLHSQALSILPSLLLSLNDKEGKGERAWDWGCGASCCFITC